jgi:hypothetical protein
MVGITQLCMLQQLLGKRRENFLGLAMSNKQIQAALYQILFQVSQTFNKKCALSTLPSNYNHSKSLQKKNYVPLSFQNKSKKIVKSTLILKRIEND